MQKLRLEFDAGHLFVTLHARRFLLDTGAPTSFGVGGSITLCDQAHELPTGFMGLTADALARLVGVPTDGLIGGDVLNSYDLVVDIPAGSLTVLLDQIEFAGDEVPMHEFMGIPIIEATIAGMPRRLFFDTGAKISYFQNEALATFPAAERVRDFFPGYGEFDTDTHRVDARIGNVQVTMQCGQLPGLLGMMLTMASVEGIVGNEILRSRRVGFFPRRNLLVLE